MTWLEHHAAAIAGHAAAQLTALVAISSPSGDVAGAEACFAECTVLLPDGCSVERVDCSTPGHAKDWIARLPGTAPAGKRVLLLGHVDTVVAHGNHRALESEEGKLIGSGSVDMKGGDVLALGVLRALAERRSEFGEVALLLVCDEEWRTRDFLHPPRFAGWDACLCFEAGERTRDGAEGVVVRRKAAGTLHIVAAGRAAHSGSAPDRGRNALLALATAAHAVAARHDPSGEDRLTAVPTVMRAGDAFNVVPAAGELWCDVRADGLDAIERLLGEIPTEAGGATLTTTLERRWPGMDSEAATAPVLEAASHALGRQVAPVRRGGASDASHFAAGIPLTIDGLGPRGGAAHHPDEYVLAESLRSRAEVALAVVDAVLAR